VFWEWKSIRETEPESRTFRVEPTLKILFYKKIKKFKKSVDKPKKTCYNNKAVGREDKRTTEK